MVGGGSRVEGLQSEEQRTDTMMDQNDRWFLSVCLVSRCLEDSFDGCVCLKKSVLVPRIVSIAFTTFLSLLDMDRRYCRRKIFVVFAWLHPFWSSHSIH